MTSVTRAPEIGQGIYTFPEAARILRWRERDISIRQLRHWIGTGLTPASWATAEGTSLLSFDDLVSLELVRRFRVKNVSLQAIRVFEAELRKEFPGLERPFAFELFWTDGARIWAQLNPDEGHPIELVGHHRNHYVWLDAIKTFAEEIQYAGKPGRAASWELTPWVEINPSVQFGAPVVRGTRVPIRSIGKNLEAGTTAEVAEWYDLTVEQVEAVRDYLALS